MTEGSETADTSSPDVPLCVDLDGTLIRSDRLCEGRARLAKEGWGPLLLALFWLSKGKAGFKRERANRVALEPSTLPYELRLLEFLRKEKHHGRRLVLATASDRIWAETVAQHLEIFDEVMGSDGTTNLGGETKARALVERFGDRGFDYAGNGPPDKPVWKKARRAIAVNAPPAIEAGLRRGGNLAEFFSPAPLRLKTIVKAIRARQWVKNLLVFIPIITAHKLLDVGILAAAGLAFVAISFCASSIYLLNDLFDLDSDRRHPEKWRRPLASGNLTIPVAIVLSLLLMAAGFAISLRLPADAVKLIGVYLVATTAYSLFLKRRVLVDVFTLSLLYTLRVLLGGAAPPLAVVPRVFGVHVPQPRVLQAGLRARAAQEVRASGGSGSGVFHVGSPRHADLRHHERLSGRHRPRALPPERHREAFLREPGVAVADRARLPVLDQPDMGPRQPGRDGRRPRPLRHEEPHHLPDRGRQRGHPRFRHLRSVPSSRRAAVRARPLFFFALDDTLAHHHAAEEGAHRETHAAHGTLFGGIAFLDWLDAYRRNNLRLWHEYGKGTIDRPTLTARRFALPLAHLGLAATLAGAV